MPAIVAGVVAAVVGTGRAAPTSAAAGGQARRVDRGCVAAAVDFESCQA